MPNTVVIGSQWGDEGKGKIVDLLCPDYDVVARYQGGNNAGHTVKVGEDVYKLQLLPSGVVHGKECVLGNGMVIDPLALLEEIANLPRKAHLIVSDRAHVILPHHKVMDWAHEQGTKIGTTLKGIGPAYGDKIARRGVHMHELLDKEALKKKVTAQCVATKEHVLATLPREHVLAHMQETFPTYYDELELFNSDAIVSAYWEAGQQLKGSIKNTTLFLRQKEHILFEGAQGTFLDIDHGTYPYVTSSNTTVGGVFAGTGYGGQIETRLAIVKAYTTRVGEGPFPTELEDANGKHMQDVGHEFGTVTGRPRRCGWLDLALVKYAAALNGFTHLVITKLDVLSGLETLNVCTSYKEGMPVDLARATPVYEDLPGWDEDITGCTTYDALPKNCKKYLAKIKEVTGVPIKYISVGPERNQTITI
ncbi:MAG: adenylosuccinate synthase [Candidatus Woesearchaeota archaeon]|nr:adenylosuccinate synthase [Candidatus Woesearchaeota archaeon]